MAEETEQAETQAAESTEQTTEQTPAPEAGSSSQDQQQAESTSSAQSPETLAAGKEPEAEPEKQPEWPEDWREKAAQHYAAGDKKAYDRELKRLQRVADPAGLYGMYRELDNRLNGGGLIKVPGEDADEKEIAAYRKAIGVPEKPEEYFEQVKLDNGVVIGEQDKPLVDSYAQAAHEAGVTPAQFSKMVNWYYQNQEQNAAQLDEHVEQVRHQTAEALREAYGANWKNKLDQLSTLFASAPGGADKNNSDSLMNQLFGATMPDGSYLGDNLQVINWLMETLHNAYPAMTIPEATIQDEKGVESRIEEIKTIMREDRARYNKDTKLQDEYRKLLESREKYQRRSAA